MSATTSATTKTLTLQKDCFAEAFPKLELYNQTLISLIFPLEKSGTRALAKTEGFELFLKSNAGNIPIDEWEFLLSCADIRQDESFVDKLLKFRPKIVEIRSFNDILYTDVDKQSINEILYPLAINNTIAGNIKIVQILLAHGIDPLAVYQDATGKKSCLFKDAISSHQIEMFKFLRSKIGKFTLKQKSEVLCAITNSGSVEMLELVIDECSSAINCADLDSELPLTYAADNGHVQMVRALLKYGAKVELRIKSHALLAACQNNHEEIVILLLDELKKQNNTTLINEHFQVYKVNKEAFDAKNKEALNKEAFSTSTILDITVGQGHRNIVQHLLKAGADVNLCNELGEFPLLKALNFEYIDIAEDILSTGKVIIDEKTKNLDLLVTESLRPQRNSKFLAKFLEYPFFVHYVQNHIFKVGGGSNALMLACAGNEEAVRLLLDKNLDINFRSGKGPNALIIAMHSMQPAILKLLLAKGAVITLAEINEFFSFIDKDALIDTIQSYKSLNYHSELANLPTMIQIANEMFLILFPTILHLFEEAADAEEITEDDFQGFVDRVMTSIAEGVLSSENCFDLLYQKPIFKPYIKNLLHNPLYIAYCIQQGHHQLITKLLSIGLNPNMKFFNKPLLFLAIEESQEDVMKALLEAKARTEVTLDGNTPLLLTVNYNWTSAAKLLIDHGCNLDVVSNQGDTPLVLASKNRCFELRDLFFKRKLMASLKAGEEAKLYQENKIVLDELINQLSDKLLKLNPQFDNHATMTLGFKREKNKKRKQMRTELFQPIDAGIEQTPVQEKLHLPIAVVKNVLLSIFQKEKTQIVEQCTKSKSLNTVLEDLGNKLFDEALQLIALEQDPKEREQIKERLKEELLNNLDDTSIVHSFPDKARFNVSADHLIKKLEGLNFDIMTEFAKNDFFQERITASKDAFKKEDSKASTENCEIQGLANNTPFIKSQKRLEQVESKLAKDGAKLKSTINDIFKTINNEDESSFQTGAEQQLEGLREQFVSRHQLLRERILSKLNEYSFNEARIIKRSIKDDPEINNLLETFEEFCFDLKTKIDQLTELLTRISDLRNEEVLTQFVEQQQKQQKQQKQQNNLATLATQKEALAHKLKQLEQKFKVDQEKQANDKRDKREKFLAADKKRRAENNERHLMKINAAKERKFKLEQQENEESIQTLSYFKTRMGQKTPHPHNFGSTTTVVAQVELKEELDALEKYIQEYKIAVAERKTSAASLTEQDKRLEALAWLDASCRILDAVKELPEGVGKITRDEATNFRDIIAHAIELPKFSTEESFNLTISLMAYLRALQRKDKKGCANYWQSIVGTGDNAGKTLYTRVLQKKPELDQELKKPFSFKVYDDAIKKANIEIKLAKLNNKLMPWLKNLAIALFKGRRGAFAARLKYTPGLRLEYLKDRKRLDGFNEEGIPHRHRLVNHNQYALRDFMFTTKNETNKPLIANGKEIKIIMDNKNTEVGNSNNDTKSKRENRDIKTMYESRIAEKGRHVGVITDAQIARVIKRENDHSAMMVPYYQSQLQQVGNRSGGNAYPIVGVPNFALNFSNNDAKSRDRSSLADQKK